MHWVQPQIYFEWHLNYQSVIVEKKMVAYRYLIISRLHLLGKNSIKNSGNWACTHSLGLDNCNSVNVWLFCLLRLKFDALWFCHMKSLCKSLYHCKYIRVVIWCCLGICLNSFLSSRNYPCPEGELVADSWEPWAEAKVMGSSFLLFVHQVTFFANRFAQLNPHPYLQQAYSQQEPVTWGVSSLHLG